MLSDKLDSDQIEIDQPKPAKTTTTTTAKPHRIRKTLSFISSNRKRAAKFCTINRMKRGGRVHVRHLSLNGGQKKLAPQHLDQLKACGNLGVSPCLNKKKVWPSSVVQSPRVHKSSSSDSIKSTASLRKQAQAPPHFVNKSQHQRFLLPNSCESFKRASFKRLKQKLHNHLSLNASCEELKMQTILNYDANLRNFLNQKLADQVKQVRTCISFTIQSSSA